MEDVQAFFHKVLPNLKEESKRAVLNALEEHGVAAFEDLEFVEPLHDFKDMLTIVEMRKLEKAINIEFGTSSDTIASNGNPGIAQNNKEHIAESSQHYKENVRNELYESDAILPSDNWVKDFVIPFDKFPSLTQKKCSDGEILSPAENREIIRIVCAEVMLVCHKPGKKNLEVIAKDIIKQYPSSFEDRINSTIISGGHSSLLNQLIIRMDNVNRPSNNSAKRKVDELLGSSVKISTADNYGCVKYLPDFPPNENENSQKEKKNFLKEHYSVKNWDMMLVSKAMKETYVLQRIDVIGRKSISDVVENWPFLALSTYLINHFNELMGLNVTKILDSAYENKIPELLSFFKSEHPSNESATDENVFAFISKLCKYFGEKEEAFHVIVQETTSLVDVLNNEEYSVTPLIVSFGNPYSLEPICVVMIEHKVIAEFIPFSCAIAVWVSSFYVYSLKYPAELAATLEFIQRAILGINTEKGSKQAKRSGKRVNVHSKVLKLTTKLSKFKNMWTM